MGYQENFLPLEQKKIGNEVQIITSDRIPNYRGYKKNVGSVIGNRIIGKGVFEDNSIIIHRLYSILEVQNGGLLILNGLKKKIKELDPDVIHVHNALSILALQVVFYSKELNYTVFVDDHTHENNLNISSLHKRVYLTLTKVFYSVYKTRVCYWMPVTSSAREFLHSQLKVPYEKMVLLPLGADTNRFVKSVELRNTGRNEINLSRSDFLIISTGKFDSCKDIHYLINAFKELAERYPHVKLLLIGDGPKDYMEKLYDLAQSLIEVDRILIKGFVPNSDLPKYYNAADIGVWPGDHSITVIEAVATGLPVIVPKKDSAYDILFENNAAIGFERGNVGSLLDAILQLFKDERLCCKTSENCITLANNVLSWEKIAEKSINTYSSKGRNNVSKT